MLNFTIERSTYREHDFNHPRTKQGWSNARWEFTFQVPSEIYDPEEDEPEDEFKEVEISGTSYHFPAVEDPTSDQALESMKFTLRCAFQAWHWDRMRHKLHTDKWNRYAWNFSIIADDYNNIDIETVAEFIRLFDPSIKKFSLSELGSIDSYKYVYYGTLNFIHELFGLGSNDGVLNYKEDGLAFIEWIGLDPEPYFEFE